MATDKDEDLWERERRYREQTGRPVRLDPDWLEKERGDAWEGPGGGPSVVVPEEPSANGHDGPRWPDPPRPEAYQGLAGDVVRAIDPETEADPVALLVQFLAFFGNACGRTGFRPVGTRRHYPNLYVVLVGKTAKGRKGTALDWIESLFRGADPDWAEHCMASGLSTGEGLISAIRDRSATRRGGEEEVIDDGIADKRLLLTEEEFSGVLRRADREGNILSAVLRQAWDGGRLRTLTRHNPLRASDAHVSVIGHITQGELLHCLAENETANGFANRFLWVCARRSKLLPDGGDLLDLSVLSARLTDALVRARTTRMLQRDAAARRLWHRVYEDLSAERPGLLGLVTNRAEAQVLRLSVVYALLDGTNTIEEQHLRAALATWDYCERSCQWIFGDGLGDHLADEILALLRDAGDQGLTLTELSKALGHHKSATAIIKALRFLEDYAMATPGRRPAPGRPAEPWKIANPSNPSNPSYRPRTYGDGHA
jgi:hypothetical protein